ncbi:hypothetical protein [Pseudarthrobacter sp. ATCC 49987]|uniref:hypothetical protein n=1 Tax=Pseudarthrobacter sp. ATCC 49987 TaxID=2698204 RepID=UPI001370C803|nr:hypothetical protein [Pseudarthrobacter sp. ATCC 49987]
MKIKNVSPLGALDVPLLRTVLEPDQIVDVTEDQARALLLQPGNYEPADRPAKTLAASLAAEQEPDEADSPDGQEEGAQAPADGSATEGDSK